MTSWLTLSDDIRQKLTLKKIAVFLLAFSINSGSKYIYSPSRMLTTWGGGHARMFMSRMETRASSLIIFFIFVDCHKLRIISVYEETNVH